MRGETKYNKKELIEGLRKQNPSVLNYIYREYYSAVSYMVKHNSGTETEAEDLFQESVVTAYYKARKDGFELTSDFGTFLYGVAKFLWLKEIKNRKETVSLDHLTELQKDEAFVYEEEVEKTERLRLYRQKFEELTNDCQKVLRLSFSGISMEEIAKRLKFSSVQHAKNRRYRCKEALLKMIQGSKMFKKVQYE